MKKLILVIAVVMGLLFYTACSQSKDNSNDIYGTWQYYGVIPCDSDYQTNLNEKNIITGDKYKDEFGQSGPDQTITVTENGIKEYLDLNGKGTEVTGWEKYEQTK